MSALRVLGDLEDEKFHGLKFVELNACNGGCVGGPLTVENPYVATAKSKKLHRYLPVAQTHASNFDDIDYHWNNFVEYEPVFRLGHSFRESLEMMGLIEELTEQLPGLDCGSCGALPAALWQRTSYAERLQEPTASMPSMSISTRSPRRSHSSPAR